MPSDIAAAIDYTARTLSVLRTRFNELLRTRVTDYRYGSFVKTDVVPAILDVVAWLHEQNAHYYDRRRLGSLLALADTREDMVILCRAQGYRMRPATSASLAVQASPSPPQGAPVTIRRGTRITVGDLVFECAADATIPGGVTTWPDGTTSDLIVFTEGATRVDSFTSDGSEWQGFELTAPGTIDGSVSVRVLDETWQEVASLVFVEGDQRGRDTFDGEGGDAQQFDLSLLNAVIRIEDEDGLVLLVTPAGGTAADAVPWQQVSAFTGAPREFMATQSADGVTTITFGTVLSGSAPAEGDIIDVLYLIGGAQKRYQLTYDEDDRATITFGDGLFGVIPPAGATIEVSYRVGGGPRGNIPENTFQGVSIRGFLPNNARVNVLLSNVEAARGGEPPETVEHARFFAPRVTKSRGRAVTREDWTAHAATFRDPFFGAPSHASAYLKQRVPELNTVRVALWGRDNTGALSYPNTSLKLGVKKFLDTKRTITTVAEMVDGKVIFLDIEADLTLRLGTIRANVFAEVEAAIQRYFASAFVLPGIDLSISKLYDVISDVDGVERAEITRITGGERQTLNLGTGDGVTTAFSGDFVLREGTTLLPLSLVVTAGDQQAIDDGEGAFTGDATGTVDDATGKFSLAFADAPPVNTPVTAEVRTAAYFSYVEELGASDGAVTNLNAGTKYYPLVKRAPRGLWSGDMQRVIDGYRVGVTNRFRGKLAGGIVPGTLSITDSNGAPLVGTDNGAGVITGAGISSGSVNYSTGDLDVTFNAAVTLPVFVTWETATLDIYVPDDLLPLQPGRVFLWGGFGADGAQAGAELIAVDDGQGNIVGDVLVGGTIDYATGHIRAEWNTDPPPGPAGGALVTATLVEAIDGSRRAFSFTTGANLSRAGQDGEGRCHLLLSAMSRVGWTVEDAYDNWQGLLHGDSLDPEEANTINYALGTGTIVFAVAPPVGAPNTFPIRVSNVATLMYAGWVYRVPTPGGVGLDKGLFADNNGRLWGPPAAGSSNTFPTDRLEHQRGQYIAALAGGAVAAGRSQQLTYDALTGVPPALDIPMAGDEVAAVGRITLTEKVPEINT
jgi:hypothetical protein